MALENVSEAVDVIARIGESLGYDISNLGEVEELCDEGVAYLQGKTMPYEHLLPLKDKTIEVRQAMAALIDQLTELRGIAEGIQTT